MNALIVRALSKTNYLPETMGLAKSSVDVFIEKVNAGCVPTAGHKY
jgi:hypothetical protein